MRVVKREQEQAQPDTAYLERLAEEYKRSKETLAVIEKRTNDMKKELSIAVESFGDPDDKGHLWLTVGDLVLKREKRVSRSFDTQSAEAWARETGRWDDVKMVLEVLDEDKILGLAWNDKELEETIMSFYIEKESWAFKA
jgi:hypothetical protein